MIALAGFEGSIWFIGVIEDVNDPLNRGRVRVRAYGIHTDDGGITSGVTPGLLPMEDLPWANLIYPVTTGAFGSHSLRVGMEVIGFFADGKMYQHPIIWGVLNT